MNYINFGRIYGNNWGIVMKFLYGSSIFNQNGQKAKEGTQQGSWYGSVITIGQLYFTVSVVCFVSDSVTDCVKFRAVKWHLT